MYGMQHFNLHILIYQIFKSNLLQARPTHMYRNAKRGRKMNPLSLNLRNKRSRIQTKMKVKAKVQLLLINMKSTYLLCNNTCSILVVMFNTYFLWKFSCQFASDVPIKGYVLSNNRPVLILWIFVVLQVFFRLFSWQFISGVLRVFSGDIYCRFFFWCLLFFRFQWWGQWRRNIRNLWKLWSDRT